MIIKSQGIAMMIVGRLYKIMLSIITPTLNEEEYLPLLFDSIKKQDFKDYEIIVADAGSKDKTVEIATENNCRVVSGGLPGKARNEGAKIAKGATLLFLDADILLPTGFLINALNDFKNYNLDVATFPLFLTGGAVNKMISQVYNWWVVATQRFLPHAFGAALLVKKEVYNKLGGFNEEIKLAEDHDFARRAQKITKCGIITSTHVLVSDRRFKEDGCFSLVLKYILCEVHLIFLGPVKSDIFKYKFGHYNNKKEPK